MNLFNYIKGRQYDRSIKNNTDDACFISFFYKGLHDVNGSKSSSLKEGAVKGINKTIDIIQQKIIPQIQGISIIANNLRINSDRVNELDEDNKSKLKAYENLLEKYQEAAQEIQNVIGNDKAKVYIHSEEIEKIINDFSSYHYLIDLGIYYLH